LIEDLDAVEKIYAGENLGFGKACNLAATKLNTDFLLFLNPDACVYGETIGQVVEFMDSSCATQIGICGVQLLDDDRQVARSCARLPTPESFFYQALGIAKMRRFSLLGSRMTEWDHQDSRSVDQLIGAFFFVRRSVFENLHGFDERYFVYFEEVDFSFRAKRAGWTSFYLATVQAFHSGGGTSDQVKAKRLFYSLRSRLLYAKKNFSFPGLLGVFLSTFVLEPITRSVFAGSKRSWVAFKETWVGYGMLLKWLFELSVSKLRT
ncbi:MAG: glycosyltransferase family 2 protein, partial [Proteobacteria bacterium]